MPSISRLLKIICLFCRISSLLWGSFAKETYNFKEPTSRSHPISRNLIAPIKLDSPFSARQETSERDALNCARETGEMEVRFVIERETLVLRIYTLIQSVHQRREIR